MKLHIMYIINNGHIKEYAKKKWDNSERKEDIKKCFKQNQTYTDRQTDLGDLLKIRNN